MKASAQEVGERWCGVTEKSEEEEEEEDWARFIYGHSSLGEQRHSYLDTTIYDYNNTIFN